MSNLLDTLKSYITPELVAKASATLGEEETGILKAIVGWGPSILAGFLSKTDDKDAMNGIFNSISDFNPAILDNLGSLLDGGNLAHNDPKDASGHLLGSILGAKIPAISNVVSAFSGIKSDSTSALLGLVGPLLMGILNKEIKTGDLNVTGFTNLLTGQKENILGALPGGLTGLLGIGKLTSSDSDVPTGGLNWFWPLLVLLVLGGGIMFYLKNCNNQVAVAAPVVAQAPTAPAPAPALSFPAGTEEAAMLAFVQDPNAVIDKSKWFNFPEIMFDVNQATMKVESEPKMLAVMAILRAYPALKLKIGGYTDTDGNDKLNLTLSDARAKACMAWLIGNGIPADRLEAEGYGESNPVVANDTPEHKAMNRRISFSVRAK
jgi:outer membrane protein OmpA-like peptidoglycan-associated protein